MSGLEIAAGAASVVALCNLVVSKVVPLLQDSPHADETVRRFHRDICDFKDVLVEVEAKFGARTDLSLQWSCDESRNHAISRHIKECKTTIEEIGKGLPEPQLGNRNFAQQMITTLRMRLDSTALSRLRHDIPALKATLQLWLQVVQMDGQQIVEAGILDLNQKMDDLRAALDRRDHNLRGSVFRIKEDMVERSGKECLESAGSVREVYTASCIPTPAPTVAFDAISKDVSAWRRDVMLQATPERMGLLDLDATTGSITNETRPMSQGDSGYDSDQISRLCMVPDRKEGFSANFLLDLINKSVSEVQRYREAKEYDKAAEVQEKAIRWAREREKNHGVGFKDEREMLQTLAMIQLERRMYRAAEEILLRLLVGVRPDSPPAWALEHELAHAYLAHGMCESAAKHANRANNGRQAAFEVGDSRTIETLILLSQIYERMGNRTEATVFRLEALRHRIRQEGPLDEMMLQALQDQATPEDVHDIICGLGDGEPKDILALKTFQWAVALNQPAVVGSLWSHYDTIKTNIEAQNDCGMTPLISAVAFGHEAMVQFLLGMGADVNARASNDASNDTALMLAAEKQSTSMVKQLLARGAKARDYNKHGRNALHRAQGRPLDNVDAARKEIVAMLLEQDCEYLVNAQCTAGKTPLHLASESGNTPIMDFLLNQGADIEARDAGERTSLILAVDSGWPKAVKLLLDWGAEQDIHDLMGRTPRKIARGRVGGSREIQDYLTKAKGSPRRVRTRPSVTSRLQQRPLSSQIPFGNTLTPVSSTAVLSPTAGWPSLFPTQRSDAPDGMSIAMLSLPLPAPSLTSEKRRPWSIYSKINKLGKGLQ